MPREGFDRAQRPKTSDTIDLTLSPPSNRRQSAPLHPPPHSPAFPREFDHRNSSHRQSYPPPPPVPPFVTGANAVGPVTSQYFPRAHEQPPPHASPSTSGSVAHLAHNFRNKTSTPQQYHHAPNRSLPKQSPAPAQLPLQPAPPGHYPPPHQHQHPRAGNDYRSVPQPYQYPSHSQSQPRSSTTPGLHDAASGGVRGVFLKQQTKYLYAPRVDQAPSPYTPAIAGGRTHQVPTYGVPTASSSFSLTVPSQQRAQSSASRLPQNYRTSHSPPRHSPPSASIPFGLPTSAASAPRAEQSSKSRVIDILDDEDESTPAPAHISEQALANELFPSGEIDEDEMSRRGIVFQPQDPEVGMRSFQGVGGAGWEIGGDFYADGNDGRQTRQGASSSAAKGKGKAPSKPPFKLGLAPGFDAAVKNSVSPSNKGGGRRTQKEAIQGMPRINKTARDSHPLGTVAPTNFHQPAASTSYAAQQKPFKPPVMSQNAPLTTQEIDGRKRQAEVARSINGADKGKGKGKEKATAAVMELSSDEDGDDGVMLAHAHRDEDPNDPIVDDDDRRTANGRQGSHRRYSESYASASRTPSKKKGRQSFHVGDRFDESQEASSPDPIGMTGPSKERAHVGQLQASSEIVDKVLAGRKGQVSALVQQFDKPKASLAQSMQGKRRQHDPDGGPTDDGEMAAPKPAKKPPRASQQVQADVCSVKVEPYMLGRRAFAAEHIVSDYSLIFNRRGNPKSWKLAIHRHPPQQEPEEVGSDIKAEHLQSIEWSTTDGDTTRPFVFLQFNSKGKKIVNELTADCEDPGDDATVLFILEQAPQSGWQNDSTSESRTQEDLFYRGLRDWGLQADISFTRCGAGKAIMLCDLFGRGKAETARHLGKLKRSGAKGKKPSGRGALDPQQSKLSFVAAASTSPTTRRLVQDEDGDYWEAVQRSLKDQGGRPDDDELEVVTDLGPARRRSGRPSTSTLASSSRNEAAEMNRRSSTQAAPKSPSPPPMSEEERKWEEWWKAEDKTHKAEQIVVEYPVSQPGGVSLPWADIKRLKPNEFLNDTLIEFGLKHAMQEVMKADEGRPDDEKLAPKIHLFNSFFYSQLSTRKDKKNDPYALVEKWTKKVDIFDKRFIVVPINEHFHWYLAIIYNPAAILREHDKPPPPEPRQSGRKRTSIAGSESVSASPSVSRAESPEQTSRHFDKKADGAADVEMQDGEAANGDADAQVQDEIEEEQEQRHRRGVEEEVRQMEARKQSLQADSMPQQEAESSQRDKMIVESSIREGEATEMQVDGSPELGEPTAPADAMAVDAEEADIEVTAPRPEVEGGGRKSSTSANEDRKRSVSPPRSRLRRGTREGSVVIQGDALTSAQPGQAADDDDDLPAPADLVRGAEPVAAASITIDDDESAPTQSQEVGATSAPMRKKRSGSSSTGTEAVSAAAAFAELKPTASTSKKRKAQQFGPADPEPNRVEDLKRKKEEEETQKLLDFSARVTSLVDDRKVDMDKCYIFTFDSLGDAHAPVARRLKEYLIREAETKKGMDKEKLSDHLVETVRVEVPQQPNYCDCGLYLLHFVEVLFRDADRKVREILAIHQTINGKRPRNDQALRQYRNEMWQFEAAQKKRTTMLEQVTELMEVWKRDVLPLREQAEREKEERRRKRKEEKEQRDAIEAARRAEQDEAQEAAASQAPPAAAQHQDHPASDADAEAPPPAQGSTSALSRQQTPPPTPPAPAANTRSGKSRAKGKSTKSETEVLELSDDATCSTSGSPVKQSSQYFADLTPLKGGDLVNRAEAGTPPGAPPPRRANAMNGDAADASTSAAVKPASTASASLEEEMLIRPTLHGSAPSSTVAGRKRLHEDRAAPNPERPFDIPKSAPTSTSSAPPARPSSAPINSSVATVALAALGGRLTVTQTESPAHASASTSISQVQPMQVDDPPSPPAPNLAALADPDTIGDLPETETQPSQASETDRDGSQSPPRKKAKRAVAPAEVDSRRVEESSGESMERQREREMEGSQELFGPVEERTGQGELPPSNQQQATEEQPQQEEEASASPSKKKGRGGGKGKKKGGGKAGKAAEKKPAVVTLSDSEDDEEEK
ncbi:RHTO0S20e02608g1_1 [Rhodotorula toruloides]|uniref:RHTO0S20e02608g1_1 n=2 Tax=Rhodotorula toruloides TaxID=5286 RepID=A0A061BP43_RHOTO|nr:SUMO deconjugating cysteine peptidase Ulp2 [Rhodotorula toruloides NP11]EMS19587.1 SUMO deconjugating cysteine peptidase Ulp2 [Rhodotorula toruloides NP11]CDR48844.1 RHTO0S20e02608g1_1 [Rhodotorula toruloides]